LEGNVEITDPKYVLSHSQLLLCMYLHLVLRCLYNCLYSLPLTVEEFLKQLKLQRYWDVFKDNGFEELDMLKYLDANTLKEMWILLGHQGKLLERMQEIV